MIRDALAWWSGQMLDLVPARFTRPDPSEAGALLVEPLPGGARLCLRDGGVDRVLATLALSPSRTVSDLDAPAAATVLDPAVPEPAIDPGDADAFIRAVGEIRRDDRNLPVLLRLPAGAALNRDVVLPIAAEAGLDRVLGFEMDRLTPFSAAETVFTFLVTGRDRTAGRLFVRLVLLPRAPLQPLLSLLAAAGAEAQAIEVGASGADTVPLRIPLAHEAPVSERRQRVRLRAAYAGCAVLALLAVLLPFALQQVGFAAAGRRIAALRADVQAVQALQARITGGSAGALLIGAERALKDSRSESSVVRR